MLRLKILTEEPVKKTYTANQLQHFQKIKTTFEENGCALISTIVDYVDRKTILKFICSCGNPNACKSFIGFKNFPRCYSKEYKCFSDTQVTTAEKRLKESKDLFESFGCVLLTNEYKETTEKWHYICSCGNEDEKIITEFRSTPHCSKCKGLTNVTDMKNIYQKNGCQLLDKIKLLDRRIFYSFICRCGEKDCRTYYSFEKNPRCFKCNDLIVLKNIEQKYADRGAILLSTKEFMESTQRVDDPTRLRFKCYCGNDECEKDLAAFLRTPYCDKCSLKVKLIQSRNHTFQYYQMKEFLESHGFTIVTQENEYINASKKVKALCPKKHPCNVLRDRLLKGCSCCKECGKESRVKTLNERYGVSHVMHYPPFVKKAMESSYRTSSYTFPSGAKVLYQGYENYCLDELLRIGIAEMQIVSQFDRENFTATVPVIEYIFEGERKYYPDFYIPHLNLIIEVKSEYTFTYSLDKNFAKRIACLEQGYNFEFWVYNDKGEKIRTL